MNRLGLIVLLLLHTSNALSQGVSLGDLARRERDRRKRLEVGKDQLVKNLLQHSGAGNLIEQVGKSFSNSTGALFKEVPTEIRERLTTSASESFDASKLMPTFERKFAVGMDTMSLVEVSRWYETPIGTRILQAESRDSGKAVPNRQKAGVSPARTELIEQLDIQTQGTARTVASLAATTKAMLAKMLESSSEPPRNKELFLVGFEESFNQNATPSIRPSLLASYMNTYASLSDDELQEYLRFLNSAAGRKFVRSTWDGLQAAMEQGGADAGSRFAEILKVKN